MFCLLPRRRRIRSVPSIHQFIHPPTHLSIHPYVQSRTHPAIYQSIRPSVRPFDRCRSCEAVIRWPGVMDPWQMCPKAVCKLNVKWLLMFLINKYKYWAVPLKRDDSRRCLGDYSWLPFIIQRLCRSRRCDGSETQRWKTAETRAGSSKWCYQLEIKSIWGPVRGLRVKAVNSIAYSQK